jgi:hypothetical protein
MALELREMGMLDFICPVLVGDKDTATDRYGDYCKAGCQPRPDPSVPPSHVDAVEDKLVRHFDNQGLGAPIKSNVCVFDVLHGIAQNQGVFIRGEATVAFDEVKSKLKQLHDTTDDGTQPSSSSLPTTRALSLLAASEEENRRKDAIIEDNRQEAAELKRQLAEYQMQLAEYQRLIQSLQNTSS